MEVGGKPFLVGVDPNTPATIGEWAELNNDLVLQVKQLRTQLAIHTVDADATHPDGEIGSLKSQVFNLRAFLRYTRRQWDYASKEATGLKLELGQLKAASKLQESPQEGDEQYLKRIKLLEAELECANREVSEKTKELGDVQSSLADCKRKYNAAKSEADHSSASLAAMIAECANLQVKLGNGEIKTESLEMEKNELQQQVKSMDMQFKSLEEEVRALVSKGGATEAEPASVSSTGDLGAGSTNGVQTSLEDLEKILGDLGEISEQSQIMKGLHSRAYQTLYQSEAKLQELEIAQSSAIGSENLECADGPHHGLGYPYREQPVSGEALSEIQNDLRALRHQMENGDFPVKKINRIQESLKPIRTYVEEASNEIQCAKTSALASQEKLATAIRGHAEAVADSNSLKGKLLAREETHNVVVKELEGKVQDLKEKFDGEMTRRKSAEVNVISLEGALAGKSNELEKCKDRCGEFAGHVATAARIVHCDAEVLYKELSAREKERDAAIQRRIDAQLRLGKMEELRAETINADNLADMERALKTMEEKMSVLERGNNTLTQSLQEAQNEAQMLREDGAKKGAEAELLREDLVNLLDSRLEAETRADILVSDFKYLWEKYDYLQLVVAGLDEKLRRAETGAKFLAQSNEKLVNEVDAEKEILAQLKTKIECHAPKGESTKGVLEGTHSPRLLVNGAEPEIADQDIVIVVDDILRSKQDLAKRLEELMRERELLGNLERPKPVVVYREPEGPKAKAVQEQMEVEYVRGEVVNHKNTIRLLGQQLELSKRQCKDLNEVISNMDGEIVAAYEGLEAARESGKAQKEDLKSVSEEKEKNCIKLKSLSAENKELRTILEDGVPSSGELASQCAALRTDVDKLQNVNAMMQKNLVRICNRCKAAEADNKKLKGALDTVHREYEETVQLVPANVRERGLSADIMDIIVEAREIQEEPEPLDMNYSADLYESDEDDAVQIDENQPSRPQSEAASPNEMAVLSGKDMPPDSGLNTKKTRGTPDNVTVQMMYLWEGTTPATRNIPLEDERSLARGDEPLADSKSAVPDSVDQVPVAASDTQQPMDNDWQEGQLIKVLLLVREDPVIPAGDHIALSSPANFSKVPEVMTTLWHGSSVDAREPFESVKEESGNSKDLETEKQKSDEARDMVQKELDALKSKHVEVLGNLQMLDHDKQKMMAKVEAAVMGYQFLEGEVTAKQQANKLLGGKLEDAKQEVERLREQLENQPTHRSRGLPGALPVIAEASEGSEVNGEAEALKSLLESVKADNNQKMEELQRLQQENMDLRSGCTTALENEIEDMRNEVLRVKESVDKTEKDRDRVQAESEEVTRDYLSLREVVRDLEDANIHLKAELEQSQDNTNSLKAQLKSSAEEQNTAQEDAILQQELAGTAVGKVRARGLAPNFDEEHTAMASDNPDPDPPVAPLFVFGQSSGAVPTPVNFAETLSAESGSDDEGAFSSKVHLDQPPTQASQLHSTNSMEGAQKDPNENPFVSMKKLPSDPASSREQSPGVPSSTMEPLQGQTRMASRMRGNQRSTWSRRSRSLSVKSEPEVREVDVQTDPISLLPLHSPVAPEAMQGELPNRMEEEWFTGKLVMGNALVDNESSDGLRVIPELVSSLVQTEIKGALGGDDELLDRLENSWAFGGTVDGSHSQELAALRKEVEDAVKEAELAKSENVQRKGHLLMLQSDHSKLENELTSLKAEFLGLKSVEGKRLQAMSMVQLLETDKQKLSADIEGLNMEIEFMRGEIEAKTRSNRSLQGKLEGHKMRIRELEQEVQSLEEKIRELGGGSDSLDPMGGSDGLLGNTRNDQPRVRTRDLPLGMATVLQKVGEAIASQDSDDLLFKQFPDERNTQEAHPGDRRYAAGALVDIELPVSNIAGGNYSSAPRTLIFEQIVAEEFYESESPLSLPSEFYFANQIPEVHRIRNQRHQPETVSNSCIPESLVVEQNLTSSRVDITEWMRSSNVGYCPATNAFPEHQIRNGEPESLSKRPRLLPHFKMFSRGSPETKVENNIVLSSENNLPERLLNDWCCGPSKWTEDRADFSNHQEGRYVAPNSCHNSPSHKSCMDSSCRGFPAFGADDDFTNGIPEALAPGSIYISASQRSCPVPSDERGAAGRVSLSVDEGMPHLESQECTSQIEDMSYNGSETAPIMPAIRTRGLLLTEAVDVVDAVGSSGSFPSNNQDQAVQPLRSRGLPDDYFTRGPESESVASSEISNIGAGVGGVRTRGFAAGALHTGSVVVLGELERALQVAESRNSEFELQVANFEEDMAHMSEQIKSKINEKETLATELSEANHTMSVLSRELAAVKHEVEEKVLKIEMEHGRCDQLVIALSESQQLSEGLGQELALSREEAEEFKHRNSEKEGMLKEMEQMHCTTIKGIRDANSQQVDLLLTEVDAVRAQSNQELEKMGVDLRQTKDEVQDAKQCLADMQAQFQLKEAKWQESGQSSSDQCAKLTRQVIDAQEEGQQLKAVLEEKEKEVEGVKQQVAVLLTEVDAVRAQSSQAQEELRVAKEEAENVNQSLAYLEAQFQLKEDELREAKKISSEQCIKLTREAAESQEERQQLKVALEEKEKEIEGVKQQGTVLLTEVDAVRAQSSQDLQNAQQELRVAKEETKNVNQSLVDLEAQFQLKEDELREAKQISSEQCTKLTRGVTEAQEEGQQLKTVLEEKEKEVGGVKQQVTVLLAEMDAVRAQSSQAQEELRVVKEETENVNQSLADVQAQFQLKEDELREAKQISSEQCTKLTRGMTEAQDEGQQLKAVLEEKEKEIEGVKQQVAVLLTEMDAVRAQSSQDLQNAQQELRVAKEETKNVNQSLADLEAQFQLKEGELRETKQISSEQCTKLTRGMTEAQDEGQQLKAVLEEKEKEVGGVKQQVAVLLTEMDAVRAQSSQDLQNAQQELRVAKEETENVNQSLADLEAQFQLKEGELRETKQISSEQCTKLTRGMTEAQDEGQQLKAVLEEKEKEVEGVKQQVAVLLTEMDAVRAQSSQDLQNAQEELRVVKEETENVNQSLADLEAQFQLKEGELRETKQISSEQCTKLTRGMTEAQDEGQQLKAVLEEKQKEIQDVRDQLYESGQKVELLIRRGKQLEGDNAFLASQLKGELDDLEKFTHGITQQLDNVTKIIDNPQSERRREASDSEELYQNSSSMDGNVVSSSKGRPRCLPSDLVDSQGYTVDQPLSLECVEQERFHLQTLVDELTQEKVAQEDKSNGLHQEVARLQGKYNKVSKRLHELEVNDAELLKLAAAADAAKDELNERWQADYRDLQAQKEKEIKEHLEVAHSDIEKASATLRNAEKERDNLRDEFVKLQMVLADAKSDKDVLQNRLNTAGIEYRDLQIRSKQEIDGVRGDYRAIAIKLLDVQKERDDLMNEVLGFKEYSSSVQVSTQLRTQEMEDYIRVMDTLTKKEEDLQQKLQAQCGDSSSRSQGYSGSSQQGDAQRPDNKKKPSPMRDDRFCMPSKIPKPPPVLSGKPSLASKVQSDRHKVQVLRDLINKSRKKTIELVKELESTKTAKSNLTVELAAANNASSEVHKQVEQIAIENQQLFERLRDTESALVNGQASRRSHEGKVESMEQQINALSESLKNAQRVSSERMNYINASQQMLEDYGRLCSRVHKGDMPARAAWGQLTSVFNEHPENTAVHPGNSTKQSVEQRQDSTKSLSQGWNKKFSPKQTLSREAGSDGECDGDRLPISVGSVGPGSPLNPVTDLNAPLGDEGEVEDISQVLTGRSGGEGRNVSQTRGEITSHQLSPHALPGINPGSENWPERASVPFCGVRKPWGHGKSRKEEKQTLTPNHPSTRSKSGSKWFGRSSMDL